jgi:hypothetical protein
MPRGRPKGSLIRDNLAKILFVARECYGYEAYLIYKSVFGKTSLRSIYYNLQKGALLEEFEISRAEKAAGNFSWGNISDRNYYKIKNKRTAPEESEILRIKEAQEKFKK